MHARFVRAPIPRTMPKPAATNEQQPAPAASGETPGADVPAFRPGERQAGRRFGDRRRHLPILSTGDLGYGYGYPDDDAPAPAQASDVQPPDEPYGQWRFIPMRAPPYGYAYGEAGLYPRPNPGPRIIYVHGQAASARHGKLPTVIYGIQPGPRPYY
jgi:hypothetical protein